MPAVAEADEDGGDKESAVVKIQASARGYITRKTVKSSPKKTAHPVDEPVSPQCVVCIQCDDWLLGIARFTRLPAGRLHRAPAEVPSATHDAPAASAATVADRDAAATKIQATARGHSVRKGTSPVKQQLSASTAAAQPYVAVC